MWLLLSAAEGRRQSNILSNLICSTMSIITIRASHAVAPPGLIDGDQTFPGLTPGAICRRRWAAENCFENLAPIRRVCIQCDRTRGHFPFRKWPRLVANFITAYVRISGVDDSLRDGRDFHRLLRAVQPSMDERSVFDDQAREDDTHNIGQLDQNVQGRTRCVLERIADGVPDDGCFVTV